MSALSKDTLRAMLKARPGDPDRCSCCGVPAEHYDLCAPCANGLCATCDENPVAVAPWALERWPDLADSWSHMTAKAREAKQDG